MARYYSTRNTGKPSTDTTSGKDNASSVYAPGGGNNRGPRGRREVNTGKGTCSNRVLSSRARLLTV